jgi:hypothetical protein
LSEVEKHVKHLGKHGFDGIARASDARQRELDTAFDGDQVWRDAVAELRKLFPDDIEFRVAREFLVGVLKNGALPTQDAAARAGKLSPNTVRKHTASVIRRAGALLHVART